MSLLKLLLFALTLIVAMRSAFAQSNNVESHFNEWDKNDDGYLIRDEFPARFSPLLFGQIDSDNDGRISREEDDAFHDRRRTNARRIDRGLPDGTKVDREIVYETVGQRELRLDLYRPNSVDPTPLVIWIHGGAWRGGSKDDPGPAIEMLRHGFSVASVEYRLSGEAIFPAAIEDCKAAVSFLRLNAQAYNLDSTRFAAWGASAGGHLAALLGTTNDVEDFNTHPVATKAPSTVQAVCNWFGPSDFLRMNDFPSAIDHDAVDSPESQFIGAPIQENKEKSQRANPISYVSPSDPPMLHVHGSADRLVPFNQSELLHVALEAAGVITKLHRVDGGDHGFRNGSESREKLIVRSIDFLAEVFNTKQPSQSAASKRPSIQNVLFIISDDLRANALGCYGDPLCKSPNIDSLAARGLVFDRAYCQGTACGPSRTSFMFSRYQGRGPVNLGQHFKKNGRYSARVGKIYHMRVPGDIIAGTDGQDVPESWTERFNSPGSEAHTPGDYACLNLNIFTTELEGRQSTAMPHRAFVSVKYDGDGSDQPDYKTATKAIELLRDHGDKPFFIAAGFIRPHYPMVAPRQYFSHYDWQDIVLPKQLKDDLLDIPKLGVANSRSATNQLAMYPANQKRMWAAYYAAITFMDEQVGRILNQLDQLGLRDTTAVVFTSDHGYHLGDHTFWQKANVHEQVTRVPLIISAPGFESGRTDSIVELVDLFPTLSQLAGLSMPDGLHGVSLVPVLENHQASVKEGAISFSNGHSWRTKDWAYMRYRDGSEELYNMRVDPGQFTNLAQDATYEEKRMELAKGLDNKLHQASLTVAR